MIKQRVYFALAFVAFLLLVAVDALAQPAASLPYRRAVIREAHYVWGLDAPIATMAGQIHQESHWRPLVCSPFACGLTQFTPATAAWIKKAYPGLLAGGTVYNPNWAIRAMVVYDKHIFDMLTAKTECDRWAFTLSAYNGGGGWLARDRQICRGKAGCDPSRWFSHVEFSPDRRRAPQFVKENRGYPRRILLENQLLFTSWGREVKCSVQF